MKFSIVYFTYRPGGLDMLIKSLSKQTYDDYELIIVDDYADRDFDAVSKYIKSYGIDDFKLLRSKKKCYEDIAFNQVNAFNTGLLKCTGDVNIIIEDYAWLKPDGLEKWKNTYDSIGYDTLITGVGNVFSYREPEKIDDISVWHKEHDGDFSASTPMGVWTPETWEWFYSAVPMECWDEMNGLDERFDYHNQLPCMLFPLQAKLNGYKFMTDRDNSIDLVHHRDWTNFDARHWYINRTQNPKYPLKQVNELYKRSPNCYTVSEERRCLDE